MTVDRKKKINHAPRIDYETFPNRNRMMWHLNYLNAWTQKSIEMPLFNLRAEEALEM